MRCLRLAVIASLYCVARASPTSKISTTDASIRASDDDTITDTLRKDHSRTKTSVADATRVREASEAVTSGPGICSYVEIEAGDGCYQVAQACNITTAELEQYNGGSSFCSGLAAGDYACCSSGSLPDFTPQPQSNGDCTSLTVPMTNNSCYEIATANHMTVQQLEDRNNNTWGWEGCAYISAGMKICLSTGTPPFPANLPSALCGPQVNGTQPTSDYQNWGQLNPCPLNACCDVFGQCGITSDFCTEGLASTGAPGTRAPGTNGCISNCGTSIVNQKAPASFQRVGYYESWESGRSCQHMLPSQINTDYYTRVHFAFGNISSSYDAVVTGDQDIWEDFLNMTGVAKILSFGGWAFSTDPSTGPIFGEGVSPANRQLFANNVVKFMTDNNLDGLDFDWEYPGGTGLPGYPIGSPEDGANYLSFLQEVRAVLPEGKTLSIAAPASYWYLKEFPIGNMSKVVDYFVFETYDFHGQWDYGNKFSDVDCPAGNCLQSQVNWTTTLQALSMITKAGASTDQIMLGMALYGRSFEMTDPGCYTELCTYTGPQSGATPGQCTATPGILSNWEIEQIISNSSMNPQQYHSVEGDILVYNSNQWVSWMDPTTYQTRASEAQGMSLGGTSDWAIDLNVSLSAPTNPTGHGTNPGSSNNYTSFLALNSTISHAHPNYSPKVGDCYTALYNIKKYNVSPSNGLPHGFTTLDGCATVETYYSCGLAMCGTPGSMSIQSFTAAVDIILDYDPVQYKNLVYASGQLAFDSPPAGIWGVVVYNPEHQKSGPGNSYWFEQYIAGSGGTGKKRDVKARRTDPPFHHYYQSDLTARPSSALSKRTSHSTVITTTALTYVTWIPNGVISFNALGDAVNSYMPNLPGLSAQGAYLSGAVAGAITASSSSAATGAIAVFDRYIGQWITYTLSLTSVSSAQTSTSVQNRLSTSRLPSHLYGSLLGALITFYLNNSPLDGQTFGLYSCSSSGAILDETPIILASFWANGGTSSMFPGATTFQITPS